MQSLVGASPVFPVVHHYWDTTATPVSRPPRRWLTSVRVDPCLRPEHVRDGYVITMELLGHRRPAMPSSVAQSRAPSAHTTHRSVPRATL
jgi:hypothetical protein